MEKYNNIIICKDYKVSDSGNVFSLKLGKVLKPGISGGYLVVNLYFNNKRKTFGVHQLVAMAFLDHIPDRGKTHINHKDFNKLNNRLDNLEVVAARENTNLKHLKSTSKYVGVSWDKSRLKWFSCITINGISKKLGRFKTEIEASNAYQNELKNIINGS